MSATTKKLLTILAYVVIGCCYVFIVRNGVNNMLVVIGDKDRFVNFVTVLFIASLASLILLTLVFCWSKLNPLIIGAISAATGYVFYYIIYTKYDPLTTILSVVADGYSLATLFALIGAPLLFGLVINKIQSRKVQS